MAIGRGSGDAGRLGIRCPGMRSSRGRLLRRVGWMGRLLWPGVLCTRLHADHGIMLLPLLLGCLRLGRRRRRLRRRLRGRELFRQRVALPAVAAITAVAQQPGAPHASAYVDASRAGSGRAFRRVAGRIAWISPSVDVSRRIESTAQSASVVVQFEAQQLHLQRRSSPRASGVHVDRSHRREGIHQ